MRTDEYYRNVAKINLNGSIAALFPAASIVIGNLAFLHQPSIMILTIPFFIYSLVCFQVYLGKIKQAIFIEKNNELIESQFHSIFEAVHLMVFYISTFSPILLLFFPDGNLAAIIKNEKKKMFHFQKTYALYNHCEELIGRYVIKGKKRTMIEVYDKSHDYIGCFEKKQLKRMKKGKMELLNAQGRFVGAVEGSSFYMDEQIIDPYHHLIVRLRRGWMPLEWSRSFPNPNTPVLSFSRRLTEKEKILQMSFLINEFFLER